MALFSEVVSLGLVSDRKVGALLGYPRRCVTKGGVGIIRVLGSHKHDSNTYRGRMIHNSNICPDISHVSRAQQCQICRVQLFEVERAARGTRMVLQRRSASKFQGAEVNPLMVWRKRHAQAGRTRAEAICQIATLSSSSPNRRPCATKAPTWSDADI